MAQFQLSEAIVALSAAKDWYAAKPEWELVELQQSKTPRTCLCGHSPIIELCVLQNNVTGKLAIVGNHCVNVVLGLPSLPILQAYRRVRAAPTKSLNKEALEHACKVGWITILERNFYCGIMRKRKLTFEQLALKVEINERFVGYMEPSAQMRTIEMPQAERLDVDGTSECRSTVIAYDALLRRGDQLHVGGVGGAPVGRNP